MTLAKIPSADILSWDSANDGGIIFATKSYDTGITGEGGVGSNNREFAQFYLSIPSLPIQNVSASVGNGVDQTFITAIELSPSETSNRLYTSKLYTEQYNTLTNSYPLNISTMKVKITDINGVKTAQLSKYTIVVLEIRDNPHLKNDVVKNEIRELFDEYFKNRPLVNDQ